MYVSKPRLQLGGIDISIKQQQGKEEDAYELLTLFSVSVVPSRRVSDRWLKVSQYSSARRAVGEVDLCLSEACTQIDHDHEIADL